MNMIRLAQARQEWNTPAAHSTQNDPRTLVEMGFDLSEARRNRSGHLWLNKSIGDFFGMPYQHPNDSVTDNNRWSLRMDRAFVSLGFPAIWTRPPFITSHYRTPFLALIIGRLPSDIWAAPCDGHNANPMAAFKLFDDDTFAFARPEFFRHYGADRLIALAPKCETQILAFARDYFGVPSFLVCMGKPDPERHRALAKAIKGSKFTGLFPGPTRLNFVPRVENFHPECAKDCGLLRMVGAKEALPTSAEEWSEIDAADGVTYDTPVAADVSHDPAPLTDGSLCRRASMEMLHSLWACVASLFRRAV